MQDSLDETVNVFIDQWSHAVYILHPFINGPVPSVNMEARSPTLEETELPMVTTTKTSQDFDAIEINTRLLFGKACFGTMIVMILLGMYYVP